ncbi:MAG: undecaprenyldiphospho-muramoylpentapeptide beta-N-acetylglucosaminyltransferase [Candidatus Omnitrophota bacterium]
MKKGVKVLIAAGGSGGHIFPAIALARNLQESRSGIDIRFIGSNKALDRRIFEKEGFKFSLISSNKFPYKPSISLIPFFVKLKIDLVRTFFIMLSYRPDVVIGFGGYVSCPAILAAALFGIPRMVHEQNVVPGRANKLLFRFADKVGVAFDRTSLPEIAGAAAAKCVFTGNPARREVLKEDRPAGIKRFGLDETKFTILVVGGSQGAHSVNAAFLGAMALTGKESRKDFQVIHLTGIKDYEWALKEYGAIGGLQSRVYSFVDRIEEAYSAADLVITRAGASAIFEAAYFGRPMILVPYPFANAHQSENAAFFGDKGAALVIEERVLSAEVFKNNISMLFKDRAAAKKMGEAARRLSVPDASERLAGEVLSLNER